MATLSFSCPKCDRLHERIKPEMVGHKVRCQCGFVFRLGSKSDKQAWFVAELKQKKELKKQKEAESRAVNRPVSQEVEQLFDLQPQTDAPDPFGPNTYSPSNEEILDAIPVDDKPKTARRVSPVPKPVRPTPDQPAYQPDPFFVEELSAAPTGIDSSQDLFAAAKATQQLPVAQPIQMGRGVKRKRSTGRKQDQPLASGGGPVWSLVLTVIGVPGLLIVMFVFGAVAVDAYWSTSSGPGAMPRGLGHAGTGFSTVSTVAGGSTVQLILSLGMFLLYGALTLAMLTTAVVAIMELSNRVFVGWASRMSAIVASVVLVCLVLMLGSAIFNLFGAFAELESATGVTVDRSVLGERVFWLVFTYGSFGIVPMAIMITGFARVWKR